TAVSFGGAAATGFTINSATQITATAPAGAAGTIDIRVTTVGGTSATSAADQFTWVAAPMVTSISPTAGPVSGGTTVTITGTGFSGATAVTFGATAATGFTVNSATQITASAPAGTGTVDIRVTTTGGTSATSAADQFTWVAAPVAADLNGVVVGFNTATPIDLSASITGSHTSLAISSAPSHGTTAIAGDVVTYTPATGYAGADSFTYSVSGAGGTSNVATVTLTVSQGGQTITFGALSDASLSASPLTLSATASSGLAVTFVSETTAICTVSGASLTLLQTGTCTIRAEQAGDASYAAATPVSRSFAVTPATLDITAGSATGLVVGDSYSQTNTASGGVAPYTYRLLAGAFAPGTTLDSNTGVVSGTPIVAGTFSYVIRATDDQPLSVDTPVITVTIARGDQTLSFTSTAPSAVVAGPDYGITATASSGLGVTFTLDGASTGCTLSGATVSFTAPGTCVINADQAGNSNWNAAAQVQQSFTVIANPPIAADVSGVTVAYESAGAAIDLSGSLTGGAHASIAIGTAPAHGVTAIAGDVVTYTPAAGYYGADSFTYTATGPGGTSNVATVSLTVATPAAPVAIDKSGVAVPWNSPGTAIDLSASITGVRSSLAIGTAPAHGTVSVAGEAVTYTPATGYYGADSFTFTATGPGGTSNVATVSLTVGVPPAPTAGDVSGGAVPYESAGTAIDLSASITGVRSSLAVATAPAHGTVSVAGEAVTYTPATGYYGADSFTYTATGPGGTSAPATVSLTVATPAAPTAADVSGVTVPFASAGVAIPLQPAGVYTSLSVATGPARGTVTISGATATYVPTGDNYGPDSFTYTATGPGGTSAPATVSLTVATPPPPVVTPPTGPVVVPPSTGGGSQPVTVNLDARTTGEFDGFRITVTAQYGSAVITQATALAQSSGTTGPQKAPGDYQLVYTPAANFMGTDTVTVVAFGPGGDSAPLTFTFQVAGKAPDLSGQTPSNGSITFSPTATLVGGPFQAVRITRAPTFGTTTVDGLTIVFTPGAANGGSTSLDYVIDLPFGASQAGRIDLVSSLVPGAQTLTARTVQGRPVAVRISDTPGGPFTGAAVTSISPTTAGTATVSGANGIYTLTFTPTGTFSGEAVVGFTLSNGAGTTGGTVTVTVEARPDPGLDPDVRGVATSQVTSARRFADAQINNFQRRLQDLHDGTNTSSNGVSLNVGVGGEADSDNDPREARRRQLGGRQQDRVDPGALG
ncbi:MAG: tandem-95 repeat protein, partial [Caulobacteraceae bacterium]